ncbi:hypothetical protein M422DRAFT_50162 [Sphaerobolus stellatus SS14]|uniref:Uncharacterized protein n=1 Tax=Sphaerobolus stellatus (strain SS14) TaxID=990650 RepID=A0A0C9VKV7_SPHS4|nr:hypothetical protein M422DRAFT_50162 [Sphaerobolus stellatus SS14]
MSPQPVPSSNDVDEFADTNTIFDPENSQYWRPYSTAQTGSDSEDQLLPSSQVSAASTKVKHSARSPTGETRQEHIDEQISTQNQSPTASASQEELEEYLHSIGNNNHGDNNAALSYNDDEHDANDDYPGMYEMSVASTDDGMDNTSVSGFGEEEEFEEEDDPYANEDDEDDIADFINPGVERDTETVDFTNCGVELNTLNDSEAVALPAEESMMMPVNETDVRPSPPQHDLEAPKLPPGTSFPAQHFIPKSKAHLRACFDILVYNYCCANEEEHMRDVYDSVGVAFHKFAPPQAWNIFCRFSKDEVSAMLGISIVVQHPFDAPLIIHTLAKLPPTEAVKSTSRTNIAKALCRTYEEKHGGTAAFDKWLVKWDRENPPEMKSRRPMKVSQLRSKLVSTVDDATELIRRNGRIADVEAVIFAWSTNPYASPAETALVATTSLEINESLVQIGFRNPVLISRALQAHLQYCGLAPYGQALSKIVDGVTDQLYVVHCSMLYSLLLIIPISFSPNIIPANASRTRTVTLAQKIKVDIPSQQSQHRAGGSKIAQSSGKTIAISQHSSEQGTIAGEPSQQDAIAVQLSQSPVADEHWSSVDALDEEDPRDPVLLEVATMIAIPQDLLRSFAVGIFYDFLLITIGLPPVSTLMRKQGYIQCAEEQGKKLPSFLIKPFFEVLLKAGFRIENWPSNAPAISHLTKHGLGSPQHWGHAVHVAMVSQYCHPQASRWLRLVCRLNDSVTEPFIKWAPGANGRPVANAIDFPSAGFPLRTAETCFCCQHNGAGEHHTRYLNWDPALDPKTDTKRTLAVAASPSPQPQTASPEPQSVVGPVPTAPTAHNASPMHGASPVPAAKSNRKGSTAPTRQTGSLPPVVGSATKAIAPSIPAPHILKKTVPQTATKAAGELSTAKAKGTTGAASSTGSSVVVGGVSATMPADGASNTQKLRPKPRLTALAAAAEKRKFAALEGILEDSTVEPVVEEGDRRLTRGAIAAAAAGEKGKERAHKRTRFAVQDSDAMQGISEEDHATSSVMVKPATKARKPAQSAGKMNPPPVPTVIAAASSGASVPTLGPQAFRSPLPKADIGPLSAARHNTTVVPAEAVTQAKKVKIWSDMNGMIEWTTSLMDRILKRRTTSGADDTTFNTWVENAVKLGLKVYSETGNMFAHLAAFSWVLPSMLQNPTKYSKHGVVLWSRIVLDLVTATPDLHPKEKLEIKDFTSGLSSFALHATATCAELLLQKLLPPPPPPVVLRPHIPSSDDVVFS